MIPVRRKRLATGAFGIAADSPNVDNLRESVTAQIATLRDMVERLLKGIPLEVAWVRVLNEGMSSMHSSILSKTDPPEGLKGEVGPRTENIESDEDVDTLAEDIEWIVEVSLNSSVDFVEPEEEFKLHSAATHLFEVLASFWTAYFAKQGFPDEWVSVGVGITGKDQSFKKTGRGRFVKPPKSD
jgi:uncharacterized hydantoinase/oxoprolinase family protein